MGFLIPPYSPLEVNDNLVAFPGSVEFLMPDPEEILGFEQLPEKWRQFQRDWFFHGLKEADLIPVQGVNGRLALRHLQCIQGSYAPKHEHKEQAVAFLASIWFTDDSTWVPGVD